MQNAAGQAPYAVHLDPQAATELARSGATLLVLHMPECTQFGVDQHAFTVGPKFMGLKMVPPGAHFISYRALNRHDGSLSPATGFFWWAQPREVLVRVWDPATESLIPLPDADEAERYAAGVRRFDFDSHLAPYNLNGLRAWYELSSHITVEHVSRISPVCGSISIMAEGQDDDPDMVAPKTEAERKLAEHLTQGRAKRDAGRQQQQQQQQEQHAPEHGMCQASGAAEQQEAQQGAHSISQHSASQQGGAMEVDEGEGGQGTGRQCEMAVDSDPHSAGVPQGLHGSTPPSSSAAPGGGTQSQSQSQSRVGSDRVPQVNAASGGGTQSQSQVGSDRVPQVSAASGEQAPAPDPSAAAPKKLRSAGRCFYSPLPRCVRRPGISQAELTALNMDKTTLLQQVADKQYDGRWEGLLGELQFAFIAFVFGQSLDGYAQWKALMLLFLGCEDAALRSLQPVFEQLVHALRVQLQVSLSPDSFADGSNQQAQQMHPFGVPMVEELLPDSFLKHSLGSFFQMLQEHNAEVTPALFREAAALKQLMKRTLGWEFDFQVIATDGQGDEQGDDDEDGPVVVHNPEELVSL